MQRLCTLKSLVLVVGAFATRLAVAEPAELTVRTRVVDESGTVIVTDTRNESRSNVSTGLTYSTKRFKNGVRLSVRQETIDNDYSNYILSDVNGTERNLEDEFKGSEASLAVNANWVQGRHSLDLELGQSYQESPFAQKNFAVRAGQSFAEGLHRVSVQISAADLDQPVNYFTDLRTAQRRQRPVQIRAETLRLLSELTHSEQVKGAYSVVYNKKSDRPDMFGVEGKMAYAVNSRVFIYATLSAELEDRSQALLDDRGYFQQNSAGIGAGYYLRYDWLLQARYDLSVEQEDNPQNQRKDQMAVDSFQLKAQYKSRSWIAALEVGHQTSNVSYRSDNIAGDFTWTF